MKPSISIVILSFNRPHLINKQLGILADIKQHTFEVIVVDNCSETPVDKVIGQYPFASLIQMDRNVGIAARNRGIRAARGSIIITLDDDVFGISDSDISLLKQIFSNEAIGAVCFKVLDDETQEIINWCHHRREDEFINLSFITEEITEGAVAFRAGIFDLTGYYPEEFFISHEGPDLALRIMNCGYQVIYHPDITVKHSHSSVGRPGWRAYYYDTRNLIWFILRNYPFITGLKKLIIGLSAMMIYSIRDGYFLFWLKAIWDGFKGGETALNQRTRIAKHTENILHQLDQYRPSIWYMIKKRVFNKKSKIETL